MCEPTTIAAVAVGASILGAGVSYMGIQQQGAAAQAQGAYQAAVARNNSILAERQAADALARGRIAEDKQRDQTEQLLGRQRAALAANGVVVDQGSALDITSDTAEIGELDALTVRSNAQREALGYRTQGANYIADASLSELRGASASSAARLQGTATLIGGAGTVANQWYNFSYGTPRATIGTGGR